MLHTQDFRKIILFHLFFFREKAADTLPCMQFGLCDLDFLATKKEHGALAKPLFFEVLFLKKSDFVS